jgi:hypothetical protein
MFSDIAPSPSSKKYQSQALQRRSLSIVAKSDNDELLQSYIVRQVDFRRVRRTWVAGAGPVFPRHALQHLTPKLDNQFPAVYAFPPTNACTSYAPNPNSTRSHGRIAPRKGSFSLYTATNSRITGYKGSFSLYTATSSRIAGCKGSFAVRIKSGHPLREV